MSSAGRALGLLERVVAAPLPPTAAELARVEGIPKSTLSLLLGELQALGYVRPVDKRLLPGPALYALGHRLQATAGLAGVRPVLERLVERTAESALYSVEIPPHVVPVEQVTTPHPIRYVAVLGTPRPMHLSSTGKVLLAFSGRTAADVPGVPDPAGLDAELAQTRARGYGLNLGETVDDVHAMAAPVLDGRGLPVGVVSIAWPAYRGESAATRFWPALAEAAGSLGAAASPAPADRLPELLEAPR